MSASDTKAGHSQVTVCVTEAQSEVVADFLGSCLREGFQELKAEDGQIPLRFFLSETRIEEFRAGWGEFFENSFSESAPEFAIEFIPEIDWQEKFRRETKAVIVADTILIRPTWISRESVDAPQITTDIVIDPKMAFGVGSHETTQLSLCALKNTEIAGKRIADIGCGSLILAIYASKMGAQFVKAVDNDPVAIENSLENQRLNSVTKNVDVVLGSTDCFLGENGEYEKFDVVVANIICHKLLELLDEILEIVSANGTLILSGITKQDALEFESALRSHGVAEWSQTIDGEWVCYTCSPTAG